jgi:hypothetical protein
MLLDVMYGVPDPEPPCATAYVEWLHKNLTYVHAEAREHLGPKLKAQKKYFDARLKQRKFEVGDLVLWLKPHKVKMDNVWQGPYVVVNKAEEWHYYTIERDGVQRRATASQLRRYYSGDVGRDIRFNDDTPVSDIEDNYESPVFEEASLSSPNDTDIASHP